MSLRKKDRLLTPFYSSAFHLRYYIGGHRVLLPDDAKRFAGQMVIVKAFIRILVSKILAQIDEHDVNVNALEYPSVNPVYNEAMSE